MKLDGFGIFVKNMQLMADFYQQALGFSLQWDGKSPHIMIEKDGTLFMMYGRDDFERMTGRPFSYAAGINGHYEIAMRVDNYAAVDAAYEQAVASGAGAMMPPSTMAWGQRTCYIADPEGNLIEIGSFQP